MNYTVNYMDREDDDFWRVEPETTRYVGFLQGGIEIPISWVLDSVSEMETSGCNFKNWHPLGNFRFGLGGVQVRKAPKF